MNKKFSTLLASVLLASAFVGTADAAITKLKAGVAPTAGSKYVIGTGLNEATGKAGKLATAITTAATASAAPHFDQLWTVVSAGDNKYYLQAPNGKYVVANAAIGNYTTETADKANATKFSYDKTANAFQYLYGVTKACVGLYNDKLVVDVVSGTVAAIELGTLTADGATTTTGENLLQASVDKENYYFFGSTDAAGVIQKVLKKDGTTASNYSTAAGDYDNYLWKIEQTTVGGKYAITLTPKASGGATTVFYSNSPYKSGVTLYKEIACTTEIESDFSDGSGSDHALFGIYQTPEINKTNADLNDVSSI